MPPSKEEKAAQAAERKAAAQAEAQRRRAEAESRKRREEEESAFANANGMGSYEHQGNRGSQEDRAATVRMPQAEFMRLVAVYDGHVGSNCAEFAKSQMPHLLQQTPEFKSGDFSAALPKALEAAHTQWLRSRAPSDESGSLATLALLHEGTLYVSCLGNGICVVCGPGGQARALTRDFRPEIPHKGLFGSEQPSPEKKVHALGPSDTFVILASDAVKPATVKAAAPKKRGTGQKFQVEVPPGATPGQPFVALYYGIEYEVDVPVGMAAGASIKVEIEDYRGVRPRRAFVKVPDGCYEGDAFIITIDPSNDDGSLEDFEVDVPAGSGPGAYILASVPPK